MSTLMVSEKLSKVNNKQAAPGQGHSLSASKDKGARLALESTYLVIKNALVACVIFYWV